MSGKLKGIYDALDHGQFKVACKLCSSFLTKQPGNALVRALHAVALERCGRRDEAIRLCLDTISSGTELDETTLSTLQVALRRCRQWDAILQMYEAAWLQAPESEDLGVSSFLSAIQLKDLARAQQVATKLYQKFKKAQNNYLLWVIATILMQVRAGAPAKPLDLAAMMLQKAPLEATLKGKATFNRGQLYLFFLHLGTLQLREKQEEALQLLEDHQALLKLPSDVSAVRVQLLWEAGRQKEAVQELRRQFVAQPGSWLLAQDYARMVFDLPGAKLLPVGDVKVESMQDVEANESDDEARNALLLFRHFQQAQENGLATGGGSGVNRVAYLGELELYRCAAARAETGLSEEVMKLLEAFIQRFSSRAHCFFDLKPHLSYLSAAEALPLLSISGQGPEAVVLSGRLRRAFRRTETPDPAAEVLEAKRLLESYQDLGGSSDAPEALLQLAVVALIEADKGSKASDRKHLVDAAALALMGLSQHPHAFGFKVLLLLVYKALDLPLLMMKLYSTMDIKNIQHESLSYLVLDSLVCPEHLQQVSRNIQAFHEDLDKDGADALTGAFQMQGVLCRAPEYADGIFEVSRSAMWAKAIVQETAMELNASSWETLECRQLRVLRAVAEQPYWAWGTQDRALLNGLQPLPHLEPRELLKDATALRRPRAVTSFASSWALRPSVAPAAQQKDLRAAAWTFYAVGLLTGKDAVEEELFADAVRRAGEGLEAQPLAAAAVATGGRPAAKAFAQHASHAAVEAARQVLSGEVVALDSLTQGLQALFAALGGPNEPQSEPPCVSELLSCFSVLIVVGLWLMTAMPKGSKKAKGDAVHQSRGALREYLQQLQRIGDIELQEPCLPESSSFSSLPAFQEAHEQLLRDISEARKAQTKQLYELLTQRLQLLKSRGSFKP